MHNYKLICKTENEKMLTELFKVNNITLDQMSNILLCEEGTEFDDNYDIIICFKSDKIPELMDILRKEQQNKSPMIMGKGDGIYVPIDINEVSFFSDFGNETYANTIDGKKFKIKFKLYELEVELLEKKFIRINKSEIVNIKHILKITPVFKGKLMLKMQGYKEPVEISLNYLKEFKERIGM